MKDTMTPWEPGKVAGRYNAVPQFDTPRVRELYERTAPEFRRYLQARARLNSVAHVDRIIERMINS